VRGADGACASDYAAGSDPRGGNVRRIWKGNGLAIVLFTLFVLFLGAQSATGWRTYNNDQIEHGEPTTSYPGYLTTGHFVEATFENWESEFLQMASYILLTIWLVQRGSSESKPLEGDPEIDADPRDEAGKDGVPGPVRAGGWRLRLYEHSLSIAFTILFLLSILLHALGGAREYSAEQVAHGQPPVGVAAFVTTSAFWFQSFQNWQSEFLAVGLLVVLSIFLRQRGSPESKPVAAPHSKTGS
jgi:membrane protein implicated in regulation of membrane protease activity